MMGYESWWTYFSLLVVAVLYWPRFSNCGPGTNANIRNIFLGRCYQYLEIDTHRLWKPTDKNCGQLWRNFKSSFAYKDANNITHADYQHFFDLAKDSTVPANKSVLWSGTYDIAHRYSAGGSRYITLEDSLIGYLTNGLTWCGTTSEEGDGINYEDCPNWWELPPEASEAFWGGASAMFAASANGQIRLVLSGSNPEKAAYRQSSFFANYELPSITTDQAHVTVILTNDLGKPAIETCDSGSLLLLKEDMTNLGLEYECQENPPDILHLLCVDNPDTKECKLQKMDAITFLTKLTGIVFPG